MASAADIQVGVKFGRWTVHGTCEKVTEKVPCVCECGAVSTVVANELLRGRSRSCGCLQRDWLAQRNSDNWIHEHYRDDHPSPTYISWRAMIQRCKNPEVPEYRNYGGRGIKVCFRWRYSFERFLADMGERPEGMTLDRIDNEGNYEPSNCRWATPKQQSANRRVSAANA